MASEQTTKKAPAKRSNPDLRTRRFAARLAAAQAIYQHHAAGTPQARLLHEFHAHRLGGSIEGVKYPPADVRLFDDLVAGALARREEIDALIADHLSEGWSLPRLDRLMHAILSAGIYELLARADVARWTIVVDYVDVARSFYGRQETAFANALLDRIADALRPRQPGPRG